MTADQVRPYRPSDRSAYLRLYETVFGTERSVDWFDWKYGSNPYVDEPAIVVAYREGDLVGARSFLALPMETGGGRLLALQPADAMVHPEHRREGLFSAMTETALTYYADRDPAFCFNFPNPKSLPGNLELGWETVDELCTYYRIQRPGALLDGAPRPLEAALSAATTAYNGIRSPSTGTSELTVRRHAEPPPATLETLADRTAFDGIRAARDGRFYRWRLSAPGPTYETYLARRAGTAVAALVVGHGSRNDVEVVRVLDALAVGDSGARTDAYETLLASLLSDRSDVPLVAVRGGLPTGLLRRAGFVPDTSWPLRAFARPTTLVARPVGDTDWTVHGRGLLDPENWGLSFIELDSS